MPSVPFWKLRRLAPRALRVIERRGPDHPVIALYQVTLTPKAQAFISNYDSVIRLERSARKEGAEGKAAIDALLAGIHSWLPIALRDIPSFNASDYGDRPQVPDDVITDGERLLEVFEETTDADGQPLAYLEIVVGALEPLVTNAQKEWAEAEATQSELQQTRAKMREAGEAFDAELQLFRRSLAAELGRSDLDYQKLRSRKASAADVDDDPNAPEPPEEVEAAEVSAPLPGSSSTSSS